MPQALLTQQPNGCVQIPVENHGSSSTRLEPGDCGNCCSHIHGTTTTGTDDSIIAAGDPDNVNPIADPEIIQDDDGGESKALHAQVHEVSCPLIEEVQESQVHEVSCP